MKNVFYAAIALTMILTISCASSSPKKTGYGANNRIMSKEMTKIPETPYVKSTRPTIRKRQREIVVYGIDQYETNIYAGYEKEPKDGAFVVNYDITDRASDVAIADLKGHPVIQKLDLDDEELKAIIMTTSEVNINNASIKNGVMAITGAFVVVDVYLVAKIVQTHSKAWRTQLCKFASDVNHAWNEYIKYMRQCHRNGAGVSPKAYRPYQDRIASLRYIQESYQGKPEYAHYDTYKAKQANPEDPMVSYIDAEANYTKMNYETGDANIEYSNTVMAQELPDQYVLKGNANLTHGMDEEAERLFQKAIEIDPEFANAYYGLACVETFRGDRSKAVNWIKLAHKYNPDVYTVEVVDAIAGKMKDGQNIMTAAENAADLAREAMVEGEDVVAKLKGTGGKETTVHGKGKITPYEAKQEQVRVLIDNGKLIEANHILWDLKAANPKDHYNYCLHGYVFRNGTMFKKAMQEFTTAYKLTGSSVYIYEIGRTFGDMGVDENSKANFNSSRKWLLKALENRKEQNEKWSQNQYARTYNALAVSNRMLNDYDASVMWSKKAIEVNPSYHNYCNLGRALYSLGRHTEAKRAFLKSMQIKPNKTAQKYLEKL